MTRTDTNREILIAAGSGRGPEAAAGGDLRRVTSYTWLIRLWVMLAVPLAGAALLIASDRADSSTFRGITALGFFVFLLYSLVLAAITVIGSVWPSRRSILVQTETRCNTCGYDLRASPDRCPECGTIAESSEKVA